MLVAVLTYCYRVAIVPSNRRNLFQQLNNVDAIGVRGIATQLFAICGKFLALSGFFSFFQGLIRMHQGEEIGVAMSCFLDM